jgi:HSP20 family protein
MTKEKTMAELKDAPKPKAANGQGQVKNAARGAETAPTTSHGSPFAFMRRFAEEMDHLFEDFGVETKWHLPGFRSATKLPLGLTSFDIDSRWHLPKILGRGRELLGREAGLLPAEWSPKVDVLEREGQFVIRADLPGLSNEDVKVEVADGLITIQGERKQEKKEEREGYYYSECGYGSFYRAIPIPEGAEASQATAEFRQGVLEVTVPVPPRPESKARRVEVREVK